MRPSRPMLNRCSPSPRPQIDEAGQRPSRSLRSKRPMSNPSPPTSRPSLPRRPPRATSPARRPRSPRVLRPGARPLPPWMPPATSTDAGQKGAAQTGGLLRRFRAGQNLDAELDAYEQEQTTPVAGDSDAEPVAAEAVVAAAAVAADRARGRARSRRRRAGDRARGPGPRGDRIRGRARGRRGGRGRAAAAPEAAASVEPEPAVAVEPEPEPVAAELAAEPDPTPAPEPVDVIQQPTWRMVAPDPTIEQPATPPISPAIPAAATAPDPNAEPQWPARASAEPSVGLPFLNRPAAATGGLEALWAESARDVVMPLLVPRSASAR